MRKIILVSVLALLAACGSSGNGVSVATDAGEGSATTAEASASPGSGSTDSTIGTTDTSAGSDDTISVEDLGDVPPQCIDLLVTFLKQIEPVVKDINWETATVADMEALGQQFQAESDTFDTQSAAAGCDKYDISGSDEKTFQQVLELAKLEAPDTVGFLNFIYALSSSADGTTSGDGSLPTDCAGTIAALEPYLSSGKTMQELPISDLTTVGSLMGAISTNCSTEEANAFYTRADVLAFVGG